MSQKDKRRATIDFPVEMYERVAALGKIQERDFSAQVRFIVKQWLDKLPPELKP